MVQSTEQQEGQRGASSRFLRRRSPGPSDTTARLTLQIANFIHVRRAYGEDVARAALNGLHRLLAELVQPGGVVVPEICGTLEILFWDRSALGEGHLSDACRDWLDNLCRFIPLIAIETPSGPVHLWLTGNWALPDESVSEAGDTLAWQGPAAIGFSGEPAGDGELWAAHYRADMLQCSKLLSAVNSGDADKNGFVVGLFWQPIRNAREPSTVLYHEALVRRVDADGTAHAPGEMLCALERLGFVRVLDHYVVSQVIDELEAAPDCTLGVNISARSMFYDRWWAEIIDRLRQTPNVASRLVVEVTETAALPGMAAAIWLATELRRCGCRITIDDFGTGFASIQQLLAFDPDIVKIDRFFLQRSAIGVREHDMLRHLVALAQLVASDVVVEGVETADQARAAIDAGGVWQQGYHWGRPSIVRPFRSSHSADQSTNPIGGGTSHQVRGAWNPLLEHRMRRQ